MWFYMLFPVGCKLIVFLMLRFNVCFCRFDYTLCQGYRGYIPQITLTVYHLVRSDSYIVLPICSYKTVVTNIYLTRS